MARKKKQDDTWLKKTKELMLRDPKKKLEALFEEQESQKEQNFQNEMGEMIAKYGGRVGGANYIHKLLQSTTDHKETNINIEKKGKRNLQQNFGASPNYFKHGGNIEGAQYHNLPQEEYNEMIGNYRNGGTIGRWPAAYPGLTDQNWLGHTGAFGPAQNERAGGKGTAPAYMQGFNPSYAQGPFKRFQRGGNVKDENNSLINSVTNSYGLGEYEEDGLPKYQGGANIPYMDPRTKGIYGSVNELNDIPSLEGRSVRQFNEPVNRGSYIPGMPTTYDISRLNANNLNNPPSLQQLDRVDPDSLYGTEREGVTTPGTPGTNNWEEFAGKAGSWMGDNAYGLYNLGMGLAGQIDPAEVYKNPNEARTKEIMAERRVNFDPLREAAKEGFNAMKKTAQQGQSPGNYFNKVQSANLAKQRQLLNISMQEDRLNNKYDEQKARLLDQQGARDVRQQNIARGLDRAAESNLAEYIPAAMKAFQKQARDEKLDARDEKLIKLYLSKGFKYDKETGELDYIGGYAERSEKGYKKRKMAKPTMGYDPRLT